MRLLIPATALVIGLALAVQVFIDENRIDLANEIRCRRLWQANVAAATTPPPASQPTTRASAAGVEAEHR